MMKSVSSAITLTDDSVYTAVIGSGLIPPNGKLR